jgi:hypothetical protein
MSSPGTHDNGFVRRHARECNSSFRIVANNGADSPLAVEIKSLRAASTQKTEKSAIKQYSKEPTAFSISDRVGKRSLLRSVRFASFRILHTHPSSLVYPPVVISTSTSTDSPHDQLCTVSGRLELRDGVGRVRGVGHHLSTSQITGTNLFGMWSLSYCSLATS